MMPKPLRTRRVHLRREVARYNAQQQKCAIVLPATIPVYTTRLGCSYIQGEPRDFMFCDQPRKPGSSYCETHHDLCHTKSHR